MNSNKRIDELFIGDLGARAGRPRSQEVVLLIILSIHVFTFPLKGGSDWSVDGTNAILSPRPSVREPNRQLPLGTALPRFH